MVNHPSTVGCFFVVYYLTVCDRCWRLRCDVTASCSLTSSYLLVMLLKATDKLAKSPSRRAVSFI